mmetsp:Transcript_21289/g.55454  ORF Transcript_21289/g.55454 Transcript_21289/m.55454 type:complete len:382 (+) Transcript_21289:1688-2833(+)
MHGSSHNSSCQHYNCGRFAFNAGCRVGEHTEQLWSMLKDLVGKLRYAKRATRQDLIDACLSLIARLKVPQMPKLLKQRWLRNCKALDKYTREFNERISAAAADGVVDVQMAMNAYIEHLCPSSLLPASDTDASKAKLAELLLKLWSVDISVETRQQLAAMAPALAAGVFSESSHQAKLENKIRILEKKLRVPRRWQRHDQVFQEAHTLLVQSKMAECRNRAEQCVLELREIHNSRQEEGAASKVTQASRSAEKRKRSKLSKLALEMEAWGGADFHITQQSLTEFIRGGPAPWEETPASVSAAKHLQHGRLLYEAAHNQRRCEEEKQILGQEKRRLLHWTLWSQTAIQEALARHQGLGRDFWLHKALLQSKDMEAQVMQLSW